MVTFMLILVLSPTIVLAALVLGLPYLAQKREDRRSTREPAEELPIPPCALDVRLSGLLESEGDVLVGYTPHLARSGVPVATIGPSPSARGTMLLRLGSGALGPGNCRAA
jgi:energy-converting hydrogenase Eha subunit A